MITIKSDFSCYRLFAKKMFTSINAGRSGLKKFVFNACNKTQKYDEILMEPNRRSL